MRSADATAVSQVYFINFSFFLNTILYGMNIVNGFLGTNVKAKSLARGTFIFYLSRAAVKCRRETPSGWLDG
jgi:hypothetical protein